MFKKLTITLLALLVLVSISNAQIASWRTKTTEELSALSSGVTNIASKAYWETYAYAQIAAIISRLDTIRYATDYATIDAAVAGAASSGTLVFPKATYNISGSSLTIPDSLTLVMEKGAIISGSASGKTLTINGQFKAGLYQVFTDSVTVTFDTASVDVAYPEWWGLSTDSTDEDAFNSMWDALPDGRKGNIKLTGDYYFSDTWTISKIAGDSIPQASVHIDGYGSSIWSEADTTLLINLGWYTQGEQISSIEGLRIFGNGNEGGVNDQDTGTNYGIFVKDVAGLRLINNTIRNCGDAIVFSHVGPGTVYTPYCDSPVLLYNNLVCNDRGVVFQDDDTTSSVTADFDRVRMFFNTIQIGNGDNDTLDACIVVGEDTRISRSTIAYNFFMTTDSTNVMYINGGIGGCYIDLSAECTNGNSGQGANVFRIGSEYEEPGSIGTYWGSYGFTAIIRQTSGSPNKLTNYSKKRFPYTEGIVDNLFHNFAYSDWNGNLTMGQLDILHGMGVTGMLNLRCGYTFDYTAAMDTVYTDFSGNGIEWKVKEGTEKTTIDSTGWKLLSYDGTNDYSTTENVKLNGDVMLICAIIADSASTSTNAKRVFKWYRSGTTTAYLNYADGSNQSVFGVTTPGGNATVQKAEAFSAGDALVYGLIIDDTNNEIEMWMNGHLVEDAAYTGAIPDSNGTFTFGAEYGAGSLFTPFDIGYFAVYPYVDRELIKEVSKSLLTAMGGSWNEMKVQYKGTDVASATNVLFGSGNFIDITGTTQIDSVDINSPQETGTVIYLKFDGIVTVSNGKNLKLGSDFVSVADTVLTLIRDGDNFHRVP